MIKKISDCIHAWTKKQKVSGKARTITYMICVKCDAVWAVEERLA